MKYLIFLSLITLYSCTNNDQTVVLSKDEYNKLTGVNIKYPKIINVQSDDDDNNSKYFKVYLGSDNHEYISHKEYVKNQWTHYPDCKLCLSRYDSILFYIKNK